MQWQVASTWGTPVIIHIHTYMYTVQLGCYQHSSVLPSILKALKYNDLQCARIPFDLEVGRWGLKALMWLLTPPKPHPPTTP